MKETKFLGDLSIATEPFRLYSEGQLSRSGAERQSKFVSALQGSNAIYLYPALLLRRALHSVSLAGLTSHHAYCAGAWRFVNRGLLS